MEALGNVQEDEEEEEEVGSEVAGVSRKTRMD